MDPIKLQRLSNRIQKSHVPFLPCLFWRFIHFRYNCDLHPDCEIGVGTTLGHGGIGVVVNQKAQIGRNCILAQNVTVAGKDGGVPVLKDWCYIGANSVVMGGKSWERCFCGCTFVS